MSGKDCLLCTKPFTLPDSLLFCLPAPPTSNICSAIFMVPGQAQHTISSTDFAKSKIPSRDLFYLKSTPLMALMAFQSLSMHCQWERIDFLRLLFWKDNKQPFFPIVFGQGPVPRWARLAHSFCASFPLPVGTCWPCGHLTREPWLRLTLGLRKDPLPGSCHPPRGRIRPSILGHSQILSVPGNGWERMAGIARSPRHRGHCTATALSFRTLKQWSNTYILTGGTSN